MNYIFAGLILGLWLILQTALQWSDKHKTLPNIADAVLSFLLLGIIYWVPFWLIFLR